MAPQLQLLSSWASAFGTRVQLALRLKGLSYDYVEQDLKNKSELLVESNPVHKKVPVLIHNGKPICESMIIVQYIDEVFAGTGPSILPSDPYERATARFWVAYIDDKLPRSMRIIVGRIPGDKKEAYEEMVATMKQLEDVFDKYGEGNRFFGGETIGYLDIALGCSLVLLKAMEKMEDCVILDESKFPLLVKWASRFCADEAVKEVLPDADEMLSFIRKVAAFKV